MSPEKSQPSPKRPLGATIMIVIGLLWVVLSGLCTAVFLAGTLIEPSSYLGTNLQAVVFLLIFGAICLAPGLIIWRLGKWWANRARAGESR